MNLHVSVTAEHIAGGARADECRCPIALALRVAGASWVSVLRSEVQLVLGGARYHAWLPDEAVGFIMAFDKYRSVEPFEFDLELEPEPA